MKNGTYRLTTPREGIEPAMKEINQSNTKLTGYC